MRKESEPKNCWGMPRCERAAKEGNMSFSELKSKEVINLCTCKKLGCVEDLEIYIRIKLETIKYRRNFLL